MNTTRTIYNPLQKDYVTFLETVMESNGKHTIVEVTMSAGGGNGIHYHETYEERFECLEGVLKVQAGKIIHTLHPGDVVVAKPYECTGSSMTQKVLAGLQLPLALAVEVLRKLCKLLMD